MIQTGRLFSKSREAILLYSTEAHTYNLSIGEETPRQAGLQVVSRLSMGVRKKRRKGRGRAVEMAQQAKVPDTEPDDLSWSLGMSLNPGPDVAEGKPQLLKNALLTFTNALWHTHALPPCRLKCN